MTVCEGDGSRNVTTWKCLVWLISIYFICESMQRHVFSDVDQVLAYTSDVSTCDLDEDNKKNWSKHA